MGAGRGTRVCDTSLGSARHDSPAGNAGGGAENEEGEKSEEASGSIVSLMLFACEVKATNLLAHLTSTLRMCATMRARSSSVFSGIHAASTTASDGGAGAERGVRRMQDPMIQKRGNTEG